MTALIVLIGGAIYLAFYFTYGRKLQANVVKADKDRPTPAVKLRDNVDYMPGQKMVVFGHHFASIAGAGPIVGPAIAMAWGWLPAILWVWFGNVFIGGVHDYLSLMASVRYDGKSIQWVAGKMMAQRTKYIFEVFVFITLILVIAAFEGVFAGLASTNPTVGTASFLFLCIAIIEGLLLYKTSLSFRTATIIGILMLIGAVVIGFVWPFLAFTSVKTWYILQLIYIICAASLPVWILLQPRDYLNSYLLWAGLAIGGVAALIAFKGFNWPSFTTFSAATIVAGKPAPFWPAVPLVIACGALSGFHSIVATGTVSKQLDNELSGLFIGYGAMFTEGFLATIVITAIGAFGFTVLGNFQDALTTAGVNYNQFILGGKYLGDSYIIASGAQGVGGAAGMFTKSYGQMVLNLGIPAKIGATFAGLWLSAFVLTTLDTATRLARFAWQELFEFTKKGSPALHAVITNRWLASLIPAAVGTYLVWYGGYATLWPGFAGSNQLLAAIALLTASLWVRNVQGARRNYQLLVLIPALALWITVFSGLIWYLIVIVPSLKAQIRFAIYAFTIVMLILAVILLIDFFIAWRRGKPAPEPKTAEESSK
jgi:carbon starvation protein